MLKEPGNELWTVICLRIDIISQNTRQLMHLHVHFDHV